MKITPEAQVLRDFIREKWDAGWSAGDIALAKHCSRGVIMGHVDRMKLPPRSNNGERRPRAFIIPLQAGAGIVANKTKAAPTKISLDKADEPKPIGLVADFPDRERTSCRFIHGEVGSGIWRLCGHSGYPWCSYHAGRFNAPQTGKSNIDPAVLRNSGINRALS